MSMTPSSAPRLLLRKLALALVAAAALLAGGAWAQRAVPLPANAAYGELKAFQHPQALIGKRTFHVAPGARIYNASNLIITPAMVPRQAHILYRLDINGDISQMWLLTPAEASAAKKKAKSANP